MRFAAPGLTAGLIAGFIVLSLLCLAPAARAEYNPQFQKISDLNRTNPLQNPKFDRAAEILNRRMLDRKNKVVGSIQDVVLNDNGNISYLNVKFDRIQLSRPVFVNYSRFNIGTVTNGYAMTMNANEIENLYPELLAGIETAAGEDETFSLGKLPGLKVVTESGREIGVIDDILFGANGKRAEAVYVKMTTGNLRGKGIAIPFARVGFKNAVATRQATVSDDIARVMTDIAKAK